jgi:hypothetical protein
MQPNHIEELITPPSAPLRVKEPSKYMLQCSWVTRAGGYCVLVHSAMKSAKAWDLITICGAYVMLSPMTSSAHLQSFSS